MENVNHRVLFLNHSGRKTKVVAVREATAKTMAATATTNLLVLTGSKAVTTRTQACSMKDSLHMSHSLNSLKGALEGIIKGSLIRIIKWDTWSVDYSLHDPKDENSTYSLRSLSFRLSTGPNIIMSRIIVIGAPKKPSQFFFKSRIYPLGSLRLALRPFSNKALV